MSKIKNFILDTNVLIDDPEAIFKMGNNNVIIPDVVIDELDHFKTEKTERGCNVRKVTNLIDSLAEKGDLAKGVPLGEGLGTLKIAFTPSSDLGSFPWDLSVNDNRIVFLGRKINGAIIVSKDANLRVRAKSTNVAVENYKNDQVYKSNMDKGYSGRVKVYLPPQVLSVYKASGRIGIDVISKEGFYGDGKHFNEELIQNEFLEMYPIGSKANESALLGRVNYCEIVKLFYADAPMSGVYPRNIGQYFMKECLLTPAKDAPLVVIKGPAGTAKTFFSVAAGLEKYKNPDTKEGYNRILVCRPSATMDKDPGALPGEEKDKIAPYMRPIKDNLFNIQNPKNGQPMSHYELTQAEEEVEGVFDDGIIKTEALAFLRGRTLNNYWFILDEMQNSTPIQAKSIVTRMGAGSKVILLGDPEQIDNPRNNPQSNGLVYASEKMKGSDLCWQIQLTEKECERSALAREASSRM